MPCTEATSVIDHCPTAAASEVTDSGPRPILDGLPREIYEEIGIYLNVADLDGVTRVCKRLRVGLTRSMFYRVKAGVYSCGTFPSGNPGLQGGFDLGVKEIYDVVRHAAIRFCGCDLGDLESPSRIARSLERMPQLRILDLDVVDMSAEQAATLWMKLNSMPQESLKFHTLEFNGPSYVLKAALRRCCPDKLQAVEIAEGDESEVYFEVSNHCPRLKRLALLFDCDYERPPWGYVASIDSMLMDRINRDFVHLEWLVISEPAGGRNHGWRCPPNTQVQELISALQAMPCLRRFTFTLSNERIEVNWCTTEASYAALIRWILMRVHKLEQLCIIDKDKRRRMVHRGIKDSDGCTMNVTHETFPWQTSDSTFPLGLLD